MNTSTAAPSAVRDIWPLTPLQHGMLFHSLWESETGAAPTYQLQFGVGLQAAVPSVLDVDRLRSAVADLLDAHENLRVGFFAAGLDEPVQFVPEHLVPDVQEYPWPGPAAPGSPSPQADPIDWTALTGAGTPFAAFAAQEWDAGFDLTAPPLLRVRLVRWSPTRAFLLCTAHHLLLDGWSIPLLLAEMLSRLTGQPVDGRPGDFLDYLDHLDGTGSEAGDDPADDPAEGPASRALATVLATLDGVDSGTLVGLPAPVGSETGIRDRRVITLDADRSARFAAVARRCGASPASVLAGLWGVALGRLTDRADVTCGLTVSGRTIDIPDVDGIIGLLGTTLPLRIVAAPGATLADVIAETHRRQGGLADATAVSLPDVQAALGVAPLFDTLVVVENYPGDVSSWTAADGSLRVTHTWARDEVHYPLSLLAELGERARFEIIARPELLPEIAGAASVAALFTRLLDALLADPDTRIAALDLLDTADRRAADTLLTGPPVRDGDLDAMLDAVRTAHPERTAIVDGSRRLTVAELHARADAVAAALGDATETVVAVLADRSVELVVGVLGVLRSGGAFLALDPEQPVDRLTAMLGDAGVRRIVTTPARAALAVGLTATAPLVVDPVDPVDPVDTVESVVLGARARRPARLAGSAAYVVFTSGTTGRPKGCVNTTAGLVNRLRWMADRYGIGPADTVLHKTPLGFDVSVWELLLPLVTGATLTMAPAGAHRDPEAIDALVDREGVTALHFVPSMLAAYLDLVPQPRWSSVRQVFCSGEELSGSLAHEVFSRTGVPVHNLYGPAEAAIDVTAGDHAERVDPDRPAPIGGPVPGTSLRVLDRALRPVPVGGTGELYLAGVQLARGYVGRPALTAHRFVADPAGSGERLYRTGDLVTLTTAGPVYRGRGDAQVKIRGMRVEPGEIEAAIVAVPGVAGAAVVVAPGSVLAAAVRPTAPSADPTALLGAVRAALRRTVPEWMVPTRLVMVDEFPVTGNGKRDRTALLGLVRDQPAVTPPVVDLSPAATSLLTAARTLLGRQDISADADLFALGLDSITAIRFVARARTDGFDLTLREVFERRTITALAADLGAAITTQPGTRSVATILDERHRRTLTRLAPDLVEVLPLGPLQEGLYVHTQLGTTGAGAVLDVYVVQHTLTLESAVDADALRRAGDALLHRHPSLRAGFTHRDLPAPVAFVVGDRPMPFREIDLSDLDPAGQQQTLDALTEQQVVDGFDLAVPPLIRMVLVRLAPTRFVVSLVHHHILTDGWSQTLLLEDLFELYDAALRIPDGPEDLRALAADLPPTADYRAYLDWVGEQSHDEAMDTWRTRLAGLPGPTLVEPRSVGLPPVLSESVVARLSATATEAVQQLARSCSVTVSTVLGYAWAQVLRAATGQDDVVFGTTVSGRPAELAHVDRMVGLLMNTVPVRVTVRPDASVADQLRESMIGQADVMGAHHLGLGHVHRAAGHPVLFDTLYVFRNLPVDEVAQNETFQRHRIVEATAYDGTHYSLAMTVNPGPELEFALAYRPDVVETDRARSHLDRYVQVLAAMTARPDGPVGLLPVALADERDLIDRLNREATRIEAPAHPEDLRTVADLLRAAAATHPARTALVGRAPDGAEVALTFAEVDARVDALAAVLVAVTSGPEAVVALALPRTVDHVIAIFAILRAGRAYLPLDLSHPTPRLRRMIERAGTEIILTACDLDLTGPWANLRTDDPAVVAALTAGPRPAGEPAPSFGPIRSDQAAYLIFTSGSTGEPKAVVVPHRGLVTMYDNHFDAIFAPAIARAGRSPLRIAHTVSFAFDMSWEEFFWLLDGHEVHVIDEQRRLDVATLVRHYRTIGIDVVNVTPSYCRELVRAGLLEHGGADSHPPVLVLLGGEAVPPDLWTLLREHPVSAGYDLYGPTEFTINALGVDLGSSVTPCLGRPILRARGYVLDTGLQEVPPGGTGELWMAGDGLARGYHGASALTADRFTADPFGPPGSRMYRTGDLVHRRADGGIEYRGRNDDQLKIRGFRIELAEIEGVAERHPGVAQAVAGTTTTGGGVQVLRLHVVPTAGVDEDVLLADLRAHLTGLLPPYAVPAQIGTMPAVPLTVNGKLDRAALPALHVDRASAAPVGRLENAVAAIFAEVLGLPVTGRDDHFFDLGGHSLLAMRVVARIADELGVPVPVGTVMAAPTVAGLAAALATPSRGVGLAPVLTLRAPGSEPSVFCIHPAGGFAWQFAALVPHLPPEVGVIGLQAPGLSGPSPDHVDIAAAAGEYLARIREVQPAGPYRLIGYSFGGNIAQQLAADLTAAGEQVELLALLDPGPLTASGVGLTDTELTRLHDEQSAFLAQVAKVEDVPVGTADDIEAREVIRASRGVLGHADTATIEAIVGCHAWASGLMARSASPVTRVRTLLVSALRESGGAAAPTSWSPYLATGADVIGLDVDHYAVVSPASWSVVGPEIARRLGVPGSGQRADG